jgi:hypothetical protein
MTIATRIRRLLAPGLTGPGTSAPMSRVGASSPRLHGEDSRTSSGSTSWHPPLPTIRLIITGGTLTLTIDRRPVALPESRLFFFVICISGEQEAPLSVYRHGRTGVQTTGGHSFFFIPRVALAMIVWKYYNMFLHMAAPSACVKCEEPDTFQDLTGLIIMNACPFRFLKGLYFQLCGLAGYFQCIFECKIRLFFASLRLG